MVFVLWKQHKPVEHYSATWWTVLARRARRQRNESALIDEFLAGQRVSEDALGRL